MPKSVSFIVISPPPTGPPTIIRLPA